MSRVDKSKMPCNKPRASTKALGLLQGILDLSKMPCNKPRALVEALG